MERTGCICYKQAAQTTPFAMNTMRIPHPLLVLLGAAALAACAAPASTARPATQSPATTTPGSGDGTTQIPFLTPYPNGNEDAENLFIYADTAWRGGDAVTAQRAFGTLYIVAPSYGNGVAQSALAQTCGVIGNDCMLLFARLDFLRDAFYDTWGRRSTWVPQQETDFRSIVACYDRALIGDYQGALAAGAPVANAPLPGFAAAAQRCMAAADQGMVAVVRAQQVDQAARVWREHRPCMLAERRALMDAWAISDWDRFVDVWPQYQLCASELQRVIDSGLLEGHAELGGEVDMAWTDMSEIDLIMDDNREVYERTRDGLIALDADPQFNRLVVEWNQLAWEANRIDDQIRSVELARDAVTGDQRRSVETQLEALQSSQRDTRRRMREVMGEINAMRTSRGLEAREQP